MLQQFYKPQFFFSRSQLSNFFLNERRTLSAVRLRRTIHATVRQRAFVGATADWT